MKLAKPGPAAGYGALLGALGGVLLTSLGTAYVTANADSNRWIWIGLVLGMLVATFASVALLAWIDAVLGAVWFVVAYTPVMGHVAPGWVRRDALPPAADALMVLSGGVATDSALSVDAIDRYLTGLEIAKSTHVPELVTSRVRRLVDAGMITSDMDQQRLISLTGYTGHWDIVAPVKTTRDEALRAAALLLPSRSHLIVVTSPLHTRRACATFERVGFSVSCQPAREHGHVSWHPETPSDRLASFREYVYERLGMVKYKYEKWVGN